MSDSYSYSDDSDELAPSKIIEKHFAEQSVLDSFARTLAMKIKAAFSAGVSQRQYGPRKSIRRDHGGAHERLVEDYFAAEPLYPEIPTTGSSDNILPGNGKKERDICVWHATVAIAFMRSCSRS
ncbi:hypothetical protein E2562_024998 [Oryza meyeriana var. granulata]|uniref:Uncharacterized protein n=1 Tax=Oryza meyeriana var. granulata TaxID=110450 RepID=A0A6G1FBY8_9ORYZ|nr:hypothetical protein E2562_024998 [Oryza meyeriana var. granulata]